MRLIPRLLAILAFLFITPAFADQSSLCLPTTGVVSGLTLITGMNAALNALVTANSGASAPANPCGAAPVEGQMWLNNNTTPSYLEIYDGTDWQVLGSVNETSHFWTPPIGGGANSIASASTTDLGSVPESYLTISGTTTITSFGSSAITGTVKVVKFAGSLTLTYNATSLILPTGGSIITQAGDTALVVSLGGGNNIVVGYQEAAGGSLFSSVPVGSALDYTGSAAPSGYILAYGQAISRTTYAALFAVEGTTYGSGDGSTTFNVPDYRGRLGAGKDDMGGTAANRITTAGSGISGTTLGAAGGSQTHTLTTGEIPTITPAGTISASGNLSGWQNVSTNVGGGSSGTAVSGGVGLPVTVSATFTGTPFGGGGAHAIVQPTIIVTKIIKF